MTVMYNPAGFDPKDYLPKRLHKWEEHVRWFVHLLYVRQARQRNQGGWGFMSVDFLRTWMPHRQYRELIDWLLGVAVPGPQDLPMTVRAPLIEQLDFIPNVRPYGFRLLAEPCDTDLKKYAPRNKNFLRGLKDLERYVDDRLPHPEQKHIMHNLKNVMIAPEALTSVKMVEHEIQVETILDKLWHCQADDYGRVHTNLSNMAGYLRRYLHVNGRSLVNIDTKNCQPLVFCLMLMDWYKNGGRQSAEFELPPDVLFRARMRSEEKERLKTKAKEEGRPCPKRFKPNKKLSPPLLPPFVVTNVATLLDPDRKCLPKDARRFIRLCEKGRLYEAVMRVDGTPLRERETWKKSFFKDVFFSSNLHQYRKKDAFAKAFPSVMKVVEKLKEGEHAMLPRKLQRIEAGLFIHGVVRQMMSERPQAFVVPIHDSVCVLPEDADWALSIMKYQFGLVGLEPSVSIKNLART